MTVHVVHDETGACERFHPVVASSPEVGTELRPDDVVELTDTAGADGKAYRCPYQRPPAEWSVI